MGDDVMNKLSEGVEAVIFDLGGVIIDLDYERTAKAFAKEAGIEVDEIGELLVTSDILKKFEVGDISETDFRLGVCEILKIKLSDSDFDDIWNALLGDISKVRVETVFNLKKKKRVLILSNTNSIHERAFNAILKARQGIDSFHELVDKVYFSHEVKMRKPNREMYNLVLADQGLKSENALFIDDRLDNVQAAGKCGLRTFQNTSINDWLDLF